MDIEKLVEDGARAICVEMGNDPDADVSMSFNPRTPKPMWECFTNEARAVLAIALAAAAEVAKGPYASTSKYDDRSVYYGSDLNPDRSEFGRGKQAGREAASSILRTMATQLGAANEAR